MFSVTYFKYFFPLITIVIWYIIFQKFEIPWSTILFCPPIMYIIYKLLDYNNENNVQENEQSPHKDNTSKEEDAECMNSSKYSNKERDKEEFIQNASAISLFIHDFMPHAKNLYLAIFRPKERQETHQEQANSDATADGNTEVTEKNTTDTTEANTPIPNNPQFQKTEMAMNLFKRIYIAFTQGKALRPKDTPLQRLCWAVFSNKDEFISFIDVVSAPKEKEENPDFQIAETNTNEIETDETEATIAQASDSESSVTTNCTTADCVTTTAETETIKTKATESEVSETETETISANSAYVDNRLDISAEKQTFLTAEFYKQAYFLWGFIQAEYIDYDLSLITEYPCIRILFANHLLIEITQESTSNVPVYKLKIYQAASQCISIEIDDMQKIRLYNSVIKFVLDNHLLKE